MRIGADFGMFGNDSSSSNVLDAMGADTDALSAMAAADLFAGTGR